MWDTIIREKKEHLYIYNKIEEIYKILTEKINTINEFDLYMGKAGIGLFFTYYQAIHKSSDSSMDSFVMSLANKAAQSEVNNLTDLTNYAELAWFMCHLYDRKLIDIDIHDYFSGVDEALNDAMILLLNKQEYGCINGAISIGMYFFYRYTLGSEKCKEFLENFVNLLQELSIEKDNTIKWMSIIDYDTNEQGYNLGIAHGIPGIILFLRKLLLADIKKEVISEMLIKAGHFLLQQKHLLEINGFYFYSGCTDSSGYTLKQGWCYGDLAVAYSLFMVGSLDRIKGQSIKDSALDILINTTKRRNLPELKIIDAGLCHGTSGIAHIYHRLYSQTNESQFRDAALYWYKETIRMSEDHGEYAGYSIPNYLPEEEKNFFELQNLSFITGLAGIGLSLLSAINPHEPSWDACLLLS